MGKTRLQCGCQGFEELKEGQLKRGGLLLAEYPWLAISLWPLGGILADL